MTDLTDYYETQIIEHSFGGSDMPPAPANVYVALHTGDPTESGDQNEVTAESYDRAEVSTDTGFTITDNQAENATEISFGTAAESWGAISHFSLWDGATDTDNPLWYSELEESKQIDANDGLRFDAGLLTATVD